MIDFETEQLNHLCKAMNPHADFDAQFTFYYDETNNIKKFKMNNGEFNAPFSSNFVLGGLAFEGPRPDVSRLFEGVYLQANTQDIKLKHLAFGDFEACLKSPKLTPFLAYLVKSPLYLHFSSINILYFSVVDIVDSAIANSRVARQAGYGFDNLLKNCLYKLCRLEIAAVKALFHRYEYPNVKPGRIGNFIEDLTALFEDYLDEPEYHLGLSSLKQILKESKKAGSLPFIMDETDHVLIGGLAEFYKRPVYTFRYATHIFDNEAEIQTEVKKYQFTYRGKPINNYTFSDSKNDLLTQGSDVIVGFVGKLSKFFNTHTAHEIKGIVGKMNAVQLTNLDLYLDLVMKSEQRNPAFFHYSDSRDDHAKNELLFQLRGKIR